MINKLKQLELIINRSAENAINRSSSIIDRQDIIRVFLKDRNVKNYVNIDIETARIANQLQLVEHTTLNPYISKEVQKEMIEWAQDDSASSLDFLKRLIAENNSQETAAQVVLDLNSDKKLSRYLTNLNLESCEDVVGRESELCEITNVLLRRKKSNVLLVGKSGVGKSAIVEGLANSITNFTCNPHLNGYTIYSIDLLRILAGTRYRGDFEERIEFVMDFLLQQDKAILFIDEFHSAVGLGSSDGSGDLINFIKPYLTNNKLKCIAATTYDEYEKYVAIDKALQRRFSIIDVPELEGEALLTLLNKVKHKYEDFHQVKFSDSLISLIPTFASDRFPDRANPDASLDIIDSLGARFHGQKIILDEGALKGL